MTNKELEVRALFISDVHLGSEFCNHQKVLDLVSNLKCQYLFIVGDFIDGWILKRKFRWKNNYNTIFQKILRLSRRGTSVVYITGNHDDFLHQFNDINLGEKILITRESNYTSFLNHKYLLIHGDQFDGIITNSKWVQKIGAIIYEVSLSFNWLFRKFHFSLSGFLKKKAKEAVKYIASYENSVAEYCKNNNYYGIITGHIHCPADKKIDGIHYLNCGDFIENNTAIIETLEGEFKIIYL